MVHRWLPYCVGGSHMGEHMTDQRQQEALSGVRGEDRPDYRHFRVVVAAEAPLRRPVHPTS